MLDLLMLAADNPVDHVVNHAPEWGKTAGGLWWWSAHVGTLILAGLLTVITMLFAASKIRTGPESQGAARYTTRNPFAHMIEVILLYLRETTARPLLHGRTDTFMPFLWTVFFFILFNNLLGLVPIMDTFHLVDKIIGQDVLTGLAGSTATQNLFVTAALSIIAAIVINIAGVRELGVGGYLKHLTAGTPVYLWPLMIPIEVMGTLIKPVALALRLFANMTAGHILVAVLFSFAVKGVGMLAGDGGLLGAPISVVSIIAAVAIYFLEIFVAFLQAFVFMFLTTVFISQLAHHDEHEHHDEHGHEHAHA